eukprot:GSChrysophyteH1.ASY1.ANO1.192.1 assembled CDS
MADAETNLKQELRVLQEQYDSLFESSAELETELEEQIKATVEALHKERERVNELQRLVTQKENEFSTLSQDKEADNKESIEKIKSLEKAVATIELKAVEEARIAADEQAVSAELIFTLETELAEKSNIITQMNEEWKKEEEENAKTIDSLKLQLQSSHSAADGDGGGGGGASQNYKNEWLAALKAAEARAAKAEEQAELFKARSEKLHSGGRTLIERYQALQAQVKEAENSQTDTIAAAVATAVAANAREKDKSLSDLEERLAEKTQELEILEANHSRICRDRESLRTQLADAAAVQLEHEESRRAQLAISASQIEELQSSLHDQKGYIGQLEQDKNEMMTEMENFQKSCSHIEQKLKQAQDSYSNELRRIQREQQDEKECHQVAKKEWDLAVKEHEIALQQLQASKTEIEKLYLQVDSSKRDHVQDLQNVQKEANSLSAKLAHLQEEYDALKESKEKGESDSNSKVVELKKALKTKAVEIAGIKKSLDEAVSGVEAAKNGLVADLETKLKDSLEREANAEASYSDKNQPSLRRRLAHAYDQIHYLRGNIMTMCRARPLLASEVAAGHKEIVDCSDPSIGEIAIYDKRGSTWRGFSFDLVWDKQATQQDAGETPQKRGHACIMCYGQTGSGKTHTIEGILPKAVQSIFREAQYALVDNTATRVKIEVSVLEVYNENVFDLLSPSTSVSLDVRMCSDGSVSAAGMTSIECHTEAELLSLCAKSQKIRATGKTNLNLHSSRSHMIIQLAVSVVKQKIGSESEAESVMSTRRLMLVDLAGSERIEKSGVTGTALKEAQNINKSLSSLGDVMEALDKKQSFVPFRNSKLTFLIQDAFSENSRAVMVFNACPSDMHVDETLFVMQFAERARSIDLAAASAARGRALKEAKRFSDEENKRLRKEIKDLSDQCTRTGQAYRNIEENRNNSDLRIQALARSVDDIRGKYELERKAHVATVKELNSSRRELGIAERLVLEMGKDRDATVAALRAKEKELRKNAEKLASMHTVKKPKPSAIAGKASNNEGTKMNPATPTPPHLSIQNSEQTPRVSLNISESPLLNKLHSPALSKSTEKSSRMIGQSFSQSACTSPVTVSSKTTEPLRRVRAGISVSPSTSATPSNSDLTLSARGREALQRHRERMERRRASGKSTAGRKLPGYD